MEKIVFETDRPTTTLIVWPALQQVAIITPIVALSLSIEECLQALKRAKVEQFRAGKHRLRRRERSKGL